MHGKLDDIIIAFSTVQMFFGAIGWYSQDGKDRIVRRSLDGLVSRLDSVPIRDFAHTFLSRFVTRIESSVVRSRRGLVAFMILSSVLNIAALFFSTLERGLHPPWHISISEISVACIEYAAVGLVLDMAIGYLSLRLLRHAPASTGTGLALIVVADIVLLCFAFVLNMYILAWTDMGGLLTPVMRLQMAYFIAFRMSGALLVATASLQTALYLAMGSLVLCLRLIPEKWQRFASHCIYLVTTDKMPVFAQLGTALGAIAAVLAALR